MIEKWGTWDGRWIDANEISHQHLSNIYFYTHYIMSMFYPASVKMGVLFLLNTRFKGAILPYHPDPKFIEERRYLEHQGWLQPNGDIIIAGNKIGCYENTQSN